MDETKRKVTWFHEAFRLEDMFHQALRAPEIDLRIVEIGEARESEDRHQASDQER